MITGDLELLKHYSWFTQELFEQIIQKDHGPNDKINIENIHGKRALKHGENYTSQMIRVVVNYWINNNTKSILEKRFVIKAELVKSDLGEFMNEHQIFKREIVMYEHVLPDAERLLAEIGDHTKLSARCYGTSVEKSYLIFEDLSKDGYRNTDRRIGMDVSHYKHVLSKVAKLHATTAVLKTKDYPHLKPFEINFYTSESKEIENMLLNFVNTFIEVFEKDADYMQHVAKLEKLKAKLFARVVDAFQSDETTFNALSHGDLWSNNIMFAYNTCDTTPKDAIMVDYQICVIGPVILDLVYTLFTSSHDDLRDRDWDVLLQFYHETLKTTLEKLKYSGKIPSLTDIHTQFLRRAIGNTILGIVVRAVRFFEDADENTNSCFLNDTEADRETRRNMLSNPKMRKGLDFLLDYLDRKGLFESDF